MTASIYAKYCCMYSFSITRNVLTALIEFIVAWFYFYFPHWSVYFQNADSSLVLFSVNTNQLAIMLAFVKSLLFPVLLPAFSSL